MFTKVNKRNGFFFSKLSYYTRYTLPILIVAILAILILFSFVYRISEDRIYDMYDESMKSGISQITNQVHSMASMLITMDATTVGRFIYADAPIAPAYTYSMLKFYQYFQGIASANQLYSDILLYFPRSDIVISRYACYKSLDQYLSMNHYSDESILNCFQSQNSLTGFFTLPQCTVHMLSDHLVNVCFIIGVPFCLNSSLPSDSIYAYLMIDEEQLLSVFNMLPDSDATLRILDQAGSVLYTYNDSISPSSRKLFHATEPTVGFSIELEVSTHDLLLANLRPVIIYILFACVFCIAISVFFAQKAAQPIQEMVRQIDDLSPKQNPGVSDFIYESLDALDRRHQNPQNALTNLQTMQLSTLIDRCLFSNNTVQIPGLPASFALAYCNVDENSSDDEDYLHLLISQYFSTGLLASAIPHVLDNHSFILILPISSPDDTLVAKFSSLVLSLSRTISFPILYTISDIYTGSGSLKTAFEDAKMKYQEKYLSDSTDPSQNKASSDEESALHKEFVSFVQQHFHDENFGIQSIMEQYGIHERAVYDLCHAATGKTPAAYIQQVRLEYASSLLRNTSMTINEICTQCGYSTLSTFYKAFKRTYDVTPTQYRQNFSSAQQE